MEYVLFFLALGVIIGQQNQIKALDKRVAALEGGVGAIAVASGQAAGNAFHWRYSMNVEASGSRWLLHFDDWMFLQDGSHLFNKTEMKKFGITVATVTLFFTRTTAEERTAP